MEELTFEEAVIKLNEIIKSFNNNELKLDEAVAKYEEGMRLHKYCVKLLETASNKFEEIGKDLK
jgi:exodeoxyribonuclease VII small subunit